MRTSRALVIGAIVGAAVVWMWRRDLEEYLGEKTRGAREKAVEGIHAVEETAGRMLDRGGDALQRAEGFLQETREHVNDALRAGQDAIRPAPPTPERKVAP